MLRKALAGSALLITLAVAASAQDPAPTATPVSEAAIRTAQLEEQIELLKKQREYEKAKNELANERLNEILTLVKRSSNERPDVSKTEFKDAAKASPESAALSYLALKELSTQIEAAMRPATSGYAAMVIHNERDFLAVAKYRLYNRQSGIALAHYTEWRKRIEALARRQRPEMGIMKSQTFDALSTFLSFPQIATGFAGSVGDLLSLFRTDTSITESYDTVDANSLGTTLANELSRGNPNLKIYHPGAFVPEYDLDAEGKDSILFRISDINEAFLWTATFLARTRQLPESDRNSPPITEIVAEGKLVEAMLRSLAITGEAIGGTTRDTDQREERPAASDLRELVRGEKLDRFIRQGSPTIGSAAGPRVGILKARPLASGGSRRETRNLFFGNHITYSGSVTIEVLLFDVDGTLRWSQIFSQHTGFRKLKTASK